MKRFNLFEWFKDVQNDEELPVEIPEEELDFDFNDVVYNDVRRPPLK